MRQRIAFLCILPLVCLIIAGRQSSAAGVAPQASIPPRPLPIWRDEVAVAGPTLSGQGVPGLALDADDRPHAVFGHNQLYHAWPDGAQWRFELVSSTGPFYSPAIAGAATGGLTIVACAPAPATGVMQLRVSTRAPGGAWQTAAVALPGIGGAPVLSLALDGDDRPHVAVSGRTPAGAPAIVYAHDSPTGWASEAVAIAREARGQLTLALDTQDRPVVLYEMDNPSGPGQNLWLARRDAAGWHHEQAGSGLSIVGKSLALDAGDQAHVIFGDNDPQQLVYRRQTAAGWQTLIEEGKSSSPSLALDATGRPYIVYAGWDDYLFYARLGDGGLWQRTWLREHEPAGGHNTILMAATGAAHIAVLHNGASLTYATNPADDWQFGPVAEEGGMANPQAVALDAADTPHLLYYNPTVQQLHWAVQNGGGWDVSAVAGVAPTGLEIALAIGPDGVPQMAYVDAAQNQVITGSWQAGHWSLAPLTTAGHSLRLAVGQDNRPHLSLIQQGRLIYWTKPGGVWQSEPISPTGVTVGDAFLGLDSQGRPKVVYGGSGVEGLVVAVRQGAGQWTTESLPNRALLAMALGPDDAVYGLYITTRTEPGKPPWKFVSLWLAEQQGAGWQDIGLYEDLFMGTYPDGRLLFDAAGRLHIVNYGNGDRLYYHQRDVDGQWSSEGVANIGGAFALAVGSDGQPRVSSQVMSDLRLYTREILWLDQHALLPIIPVKSNTE